MIFTWLKTRRRRKWLAAPFPADWQGWLSENVHHYPRLAAAEQAKLRDAVRIIVAEKNWEGCGGLAMTDEIKVTIAGHAAVMLLGVEGYYFDRVQSVLVYPTAYKHPPRMQGHGGVVDEEQATFGEAWHYGPIVLSWKDVGRAGRRTRAGRNLVIHEFAHHLDGLNGYVDGTPPLASRRDERRWEEITDDEYWRLVESAQRGRATLLDQYGAEDRAEFFAVASECFFELPSALRERHPELYDILRNFYRQDPAEWDRPAA